MKEIFTRASVRKYLDKPVEREKCVLLLQAAMAAPSAGNQQPWEFIVVEERETLKKLSAASPFGGCVADAPMAIVAAGNMTKCHFPQNWMMDMSAAVENLLLEAEYLGLGAVWLGIAPEDDRMRAVSQLISLPPDILPFAIVPVGYPAVAPQLHNRYDEKRVHYGKW